MGENMEQKLVSGGITRKNLSTIRNKSRLNLMPTRLPNLDKAFLA